MNLNRETTSMNNIYSNEMENINLSIFLIYKK